MAEHNCKRCGECCLTVGRTFWKAGNLLCDGRPFGEIAELNERANNGDHEDSGLPCEMFDMRNNIGFCLIHERYGYKAKPKACRTYPENGDLCFNEKGM